MSTRRRRCLGAALLCGATPVFAAPASAADRKPAKVGFFIAPVGTPSLRFAARPGSAITGRVRVANLGARARTIRLTPADLVTADTGGASFPTAAPKAVGTWLELERSSVRVPGRSRAIVRFRARVPATATPGEHYGGIVAVDAADAAAARKPGSARNGVEIRHLARLALPVRLTLPGTPDPRLAITDMHFSVDASGSSLRVGLQNAGNRIIRQADVTLKVTQGGRRLLTVDEEVRDFITGSSISYPVAWPGQVEPGSYRVTGVIRPRGAPSIAVDRTVDFTPKLARTLEEKTGVPAVPGDGSPPWMWAVLALVLSAAVAMTTAYVRLRRRLHVA